MIRALIADDSPTARALLVALLSSDSEIQVVGEAKDGAEAVDLARALRPDVITMDIQMPGLDGFEATKRILAERSVPIVIVSGLDVRDVTVSLEALRVGALAVMPKPGGPKNAGFESESRQFLATVKAMARVKMVRRAHAAEAPAPVRVAEEPARRARPVELVGIAASTGGPAALHRILSELPADYPHPILVVQHIALGFATGLAHWLDGASPLQVCVASDGANLEAGRVYVAPDNRHLGVTRDRKIALSDAPPIGGFRPSGDHLFRTLAEVADGGSVGVVLTGMGRDGVEGLRAIHEAGGVVLAQDESTSDVWGMPAAAVGAGLADAILPLPSIASHLLELG